MALTLFGVLLIALVLGIPIAISLGVAVLVAMLTQDTHTSLVMIAQRMFTSVDSFPFMAVPFFILAGNLMEKGGISKRIINFATVFLHKLPASLSVITTAASAFFGAISGSNPATVAAIGGLMVPEMIKKGYPRENAGAVAAASGTLGVIIPPSISMVTYGVTASVAISELFIGGIVPGLLLALGLMVVGVILNKDYEIKENTSYTLKDVFAIFVDAIWALLMPLIILGGIYGGVFTPTEASAVACLYAFLVSKFVYRELQWSDLKDIFAQSATSAALVMFVITLSAPFSWLMTSANVPTTLAQTILEVFESKYVILLLINLILLFLGMFLETQSIILLMTPMLLPLAVQVGLDPLALGLIIVLNTSIGMITPPMAVNLFVASTISKVSIEQLSKKVLPYLVVEIAILLLLTYNSGILTWLPNALK